MKDSLVEDSLPIRCGWTEKVFKGGVTDPELDDAIERSASETGSGSAMARFSDCCEPKDYCVLKGGFEASGRVW